MLNRKYYPIYTVGAAVVAVGVIWAGVPASSVLLLALVLACPLMMLTMHRGRGGGHGGGGGHAGHSAGPAVPDSHAGHHHDPAAEQDRPSPSDPTIRR